MPAMKHRLHQYGVRAMRACVRANCAWLHTNYVLSLCQPMRMQDLTDMTQTDTNTDNHRRKDTNRNTDGQTARLSK